VILSLKKEQILIGIKLMSFLIVWNKNLFFFFFEFLLLNLNRQVLIKLQRHFIICFLWSKIYLFHPMWKNHTVLKINHINLMLIKFSFALNTIVLYLDLNWMPVSKHIHLSLVNSSPFLPPRKDPFSFNQNLSNQILFSILIAPSNLDLSSKYC
jgi:hypothetical protein